MSSDVTERLHDDAAFAPLAHTWVRTAGGPADHEIVQMEAGLRSLIKRERSDAIQAERTAESFRARGFEAAVYRGPGGPGGSRTRAIAFIGRDRAVVREALEIEAAMLGGVAERAGAVCRFGELLGYPPCCAETLSKEARHDDATQIARLAQACESPLMPADNWVSNQLRPFSHFPCVPGCPATRALVRKTLDLFSQSIPSYGEALRKALASVAVFQPAVELFALLQGAKVEGRSIGYDGVLSHRNLGVSANDPALNQPSFRAFYLRVVELLESGDRVLTTPAEMVVERAGRTVGHIRFEDAGAMFVRDFTGETLS
jgi:hypothetical protein